MKFDHLVAEQNMRYNAAMTETITITTPDDWHCHLRDDAALTRTVTDTAAQFARAIVMPNLREPVTTTAKALQYRERILQQISAGRDFTPLMTLYLTSQLTIDELQRAKDSGHIVACKLYPAGATTNSDYGVADLTEIHPLFAAMEKLGLKLLIHGESINPSTDIFDREQEFIELQLTKILKKFPALKIVLEHISTAHAVNFVKNAPDNLAATITPHHLLFNRNDLLVGGIKPHYYCLPILKRNTDQAALIEAATSGNPKFFLGTDSAPHTVNSKQSSCGCAGIYSAHNAIEIYTEIFAQHNALDKLNHFASHFGPQFYELPVNSTTMTLVKNKNIVPEQLTFANETVLPLKAGETLNWSIQC